MPVTSRLCSATTCALAGLLLLSATVLSGCLATPDPVRSVDYEPKEGIAPLMVSFSVNTSDPGLRVTWDFGDGATGSGVQTKHVYAVPGEYSAAVSWTRAGSAAGNRSGLGVTVHDPKNLPGDYAVGNLSGADMVYLATLKKKIDLFDQYLIEFTYLNKSYGTPMRYTSRDFQFAMKQSLAQLESINTSPELDEVRESARILFTNATDGAYAEFLAGISLETKDEAKADAYLAEAGPKMEVAKQERDRLVAMLEALNDSGRSG